MMVWLDYAILVIIAASALLSLLRGFVREALSLITWVLAFFIASHFYEGMSDYFTYFNDTLIRNGVAIVVLFIITLVAGTLTGHIIASIMNKTGLGGLDRLLGICFGALRGALIVVALLFFLDTFTSMSNTDAWHNSVLVPQFSDVFRWFFDYLKDTSSLIPHNSGEIMQQHSRDIMDGAGKLLDSAKEMAK